MKKYWLWFYGDKNPYKPHEKAIKWWPDIATIWWWRWCLYHDWRPWRGLARERIRLYYVRRIKYRVLRYPICLLRKHQPYKTGSWGWSGISCSRCHRMLEYKKYAPIYPDSRRKWM